MYRCKWCNLNNKSYIDYHDKEWGTLNTDEHYLYEMFILETFQSGLSWEVILNKREAFREAYDNFDIDKVILYEEDKIEELINNKNIVRNKLKIKASINNSKIYKSIVMEYGSFYKYLCSFTEGEIIHERGLTMSSLSNGISCDLSLRGMKFVGSTIIYSYLQAIGIIDDHELNCDCY